MPPNSFPMRAATSGASWSVRMNEMANWLSVQTVEIEVKEAK
jgi:hypothetical protein